MGAASRGLHRIKTKFDLKFLKVVPIPTKSGNVLPILGKKWHGCAIKNNNLADLLNALEGS